MQLLEIPVILPRLDRAAIEANFQQPDSAWLDAQADAKMLQEQTNQGRPKTKHSFSGGHDCMRKSGYGFLAVPPSNETADEVTRRDWKRQAAKGDWVHARWQTVLQDSGLVARYEMGTFGAVDGIEFWIDEKTMPTGRYQQKETLRLGSGRSDAILNLDGEQVLCSLKTEADKYFYPHPKMQRFADWKLLQYEEQIQLEMWALGIDRAIVIVINRERHWFKDVREYEARLNPALLDKLFARFTLINSFVDRGELPPVDPEEWRRSCRLCPWELACQPGMRELREGNQYLRDRIYSKGNY